VVRTASSRRTMHISRWRSFLHTDNALMAGNIIRMQAMLSSACGIPSRRAVAREGQPQITARDAATQV